MGVSQPKFSSGAYLTRNTLAWLVPILVASGLFIAICLNPASFMRDRVFFPLLIIYGLVAPVGGFWAIYQSIRYEENPWKCAAIVVFVPFGFIWYYFEKYRRRAIGLSRLHR
jgi:hypothetical protein